MDQANPSLETPFTYQERLLEEQAPRKIVERAAVRIVPLGVDHRRFATEIVDNLKGGFEWEDVGQILFHCYFLLEEFAYLPSDLRADSVMEIFKEVTFLTPPPLLPKKNDAVLLRSMVFPLVHRLSPELIKSLRNIPAISGVPMEEDIARHTGEMRAFLHQEMSWKNLYVAIYYTIGFVSKYEDLIYQDKYHLAEEIVKDLLDGTGAPDRLPHFYTTIFGRFFRPILRELLRRTEGKPADRWLR